MIERVYEYGRTFEVKVETASKDMIVVIAPDINEGFVLLGHGLTDLPSPGDKGIIVFERDSKRGHWQYYKNDLQKRLVTNILKASELITNAKKSDKPTYHGAMLIHCSGSEFKSFMEQDINIFCSPAQADLIRKRKMELGIE